MKINKKNQRGDRPLGEQRLKETVVPVGVHSLAVSQARSFANVARSLSLGISDPMDQGQLLAYLVNSGLAIELYLKTLMIGGRGGVVTRGHDLEELYRLFPSFLCDFLENTFASRRPKEGWTVTMHALTLNSIAPARPGAMPRPRYETFADTLVSSKDAFVRARYFFDQIQLGDWSVFAYAPGPVEAAISALDAAYVHLVAGSFSNGRDMTI